MSNDAYKNYRQIKFVIFKIRNAMKMMYPIALIAFFTTFFNPCFAQIITKEKTIEMGGSVMSPSKDIIANILNSKDHTTLLAAIRAADMVEILQSAGPFTLFAPTNAAFELLPAGTVGALLKTENKGNLNIILKCHVVAGKLSTTDLIKMVEAGNGAAMLTTMAGKPLVITLDGGKLIVKDEKGGIGYIIVKDVIQSNGIIHSVDHVLLPKDLQE